MSTDPFSDILKFMNTETVVSGGFSAGGTWAIRFPEMEKIKFSAIVQGSCWLCVDGEETPVHAQAGDLFLLSAQRAFVLASSPTVVPVDAATLFTDDAVTIVTLGDGTGCFQLGGFVHLDPVNGGLLTEVLPALIHVRSTAPQAAILQWVVAQLVQEQTAALPGSSFAATQLAQLMFLQILRAHLASAGDLPPGLLRALSDPLLAPALRLMHGEPGQAWQLTELAQAAAMSRTTFALRFKQAAGVPPLTYLSAWRMRLAERTLREGDIPVADLARSLGYTSESAFSNAFKRATGYAPKRYRSGVNAHTIQ